MFITQSQSNQTSNPGLTTSRRDLMKFLGAAGAMAMLSGQARAEAQAVATPNLQGAGFYKQKIGDIEVILLSDGTFPFSPPYPLFGANASEDAVKGALAEHFIAYDHVLGHVNALVIKTASANILIDSGCGTAFGPTTGQTKRVLQNAGLSPDDISTVVLTHAHGDHFGGLLDASGAPVFSKATHLVHKTEFDFWTGENPDLGKSGVPQETRPGFIAGAQNVLKALNGKLDMLPANNVIAAGIEAVPAPGHTPGHVMIRVSSGDKTLLHITDVAHHIALSLPHPEWYLGFDTDREMAIATRKRVYDQCATDKLLVTGSHLPFPGAGHIKKDGDAYRFVPVIWEW